jgi:hypothetical protein
MATKRSQAAAGGGSVPSKASKAKQALSSDAPALAVAVAPVTPEADGEQSAATATLTPTPAPDPLPEKKTSVERRRSVREKCVAPAVLQPPSGDASVEAAHGVTVQDLSLGGVGFRATGKFAPGETYRITLGKGPLLLNARVRIVSCRQVGHRMFHVGAEFC